MPRPVLNSLPSGSLNLRTSTASLASRAAISLDGPSLHSRLRQKRAKPYVEAIRRLYVNVHGVDEEALEDVILAIGNEFGDLAIEQRPDRIVRMVPFCDDEGVLHRTGIVTIFNPRAPGPPAPPSTRHVIVEVYQPMPSELLERARSLALHPNYAFIELYANTLRAVATNGAVSVVQP